MTSLNTSSFESRGEYLARAAGHAACVAALTVAHPTRYLRCSSRTPTPARASRRISAYSCVLLRSVITPTPTPTAATADSRGCR